MMHFERFPFPLAQTFSLTACLTWTAVVIGLVAVTGYGFNQLMRRRRLGSRLYLFGELCRAHGLGTKDVGLMRRIAAKHTLSYPDTLFVDPHLLDRLIDPPDPDFRLDDVVRLRKKLFRREEETSEETPSDDENREQ